MLEFAIQSTAEVVAWVLGFGSIAHVLAPDWLKDPFQQELEAAAKGYSPPSSDCPQHLK